MFMLRSIEKLQDKVKGPLSERFGPKARILTVEFYGTEIRGLAFCPGRVVKYVFQCQTDKFSTYDLLFVS